MNALLHKKGLLIAGPCSAESLEQLLSTAEQLSALKKVDIFRAGIWKPRSRPGSFEGVGNVGLNWMKAVKDQFHLPTAVEIATTYQLEAALKVEIDYLWIGARTSVNPFSMQELADALKGYQGPLLIKNPLNADIDLWTGAVERIMAAGVTNLALIHRGFSSYGSKKYRNEPYWYLVVEMRRRFPNLPIICDPSHIAGDRSLIYEVAQNALDLQYDGLMIETHSNPDLALSDAKQQLTPQAFHNILEQLIYRRPNVDEPTFNKTLDVLRQKIDRIDDELLYLISERMRLVDELATIKRDNNVSILQTQRWFSIVARAKDKMHTLGLSEAFISNYFNAIHDESMRHQQSLMNPND